MNQQAITDRFNKFHGKGEDPGLDTPDEGPENILQRKCLKYCKEYGYPVFHDYSRKKNEAGWPDLMIFLPEGHMCLIELKSGNAKLRKEQQELKRHLLYMGHRVYIVRSYVKFLEVVRKDG